MGMDVYGKNPSTESGKYFRNNVWWWRPLWEYCQSVSKIANKVENGHSNDGDGLGKRDSITFANDLILELSSGRTKKYEKEYTARIKAIPKQKCWLCHGTGKRKAPPETGAGNDPCNACDSTGMTEPMEKNYPFSVDNVKEFADFLLHSGGFRIC